MEQPSPSALLTELPRVKHVVVNKRRDPRLFGYEDGREVVDGPHQQLTIGQVGEQRAPVPRHAVDLVVVQVDANQRIAAPATTSTDSSEIQHPDQASVWD